jgi:hypothetical protein
MWCCRCSFGAMTLQSLGTVVTDRLDFHTDRYVYPVGFRTSREFLSMRNPSERTVYTSEIVDEGGAKPVFQVTPADDPQCVIRAPSSSAAWKAVLVAVNALRARTLGKTYTSSVSGPEYFGFAHPVVSRLLGTLPGVELCSRYSPVDPNQPPVKRARSQRQRANNGDDAADDGDGDDGDDSPDGGACKIRLPTALFNRGSRAAQQPAAAAAAARRPTRRQQLFGVRRVAAIRGVECATTDMERFIVAHNIARHSPHDDDDDRRRRQRRRR